MEHKTVKHRYARVSKTAVAAGISRLDRREMHMCAVHENIEPLQSGHPSYDHDLPFTDPNDHYHLSHDQRNPQDIGALLHDHEGDPALNVRAALDIKY